MRLPAILDPFVKGAAPAVMTRLALDWMIERVSIDGLIEGVAEGQYDRQFLVSHIVEVMADVACGFRPSTRAAFLKRQFEHIASLSAFYRKLGRMEVGVSAAIVRQTAARARELIMAAGGSLPEPIPGYATRILDGNVLTGTDHRIDELRSTRAATLPGKSLAVYEPLSGLVLDIVLEENAHTQERALLDQVTVEAGQLWIMDRNFCVRTFLLRIHREDAFFLVRRHASTLPFEPIEEPRSVGRCASGEIFEQPILIEDPNCEGHTYRLRRIALRLDQPTREGETDIVLITNLPREVTADVCCEAYRGRWEIEKHFQRLTDLLHCEIPTLGYPRAALFAFCMSVVAGNALAILKGSLRAVHGDVMIAELSFYALVKDVAEVYPGMIIAVPPTEWGFLQGSSVDQVAEALNALAATVPIERMLRSPRGPKKPRKSRDSSGSRIHHVATKKLLDASRGLPPPEVAKPKRGKPKS
ncbi:MAG: transposase [Isosphaeraceae bacterium]|nr:transposase [Isosphaeraceae bacterium]